MTETIIKEPVEGEPGAVEPPTQPPSEPQAAPSAVDEASLKAILEPLVQAEVEKRTQSVKDKRIAKQESRISSIEDTLAQFKELQDDGMSEKQAILHMEMKEFLASQGQEVPTEAPPGEGPAVQPKVADEAYLSPFLESLGLEDRDPDVIDILRKNRDPASRIIAMGELSKSRKQAQTPPNPAAVQPTGAGGAVQPETLESVTAQLNEELAKPASPETRARIRELGKQQKELLPKK